MPKRKRSQIMNQNKPRPDLARPRTEFIFSGFKNDGKSAPLVKALFLGLGKIRFCMFKGDRFVVEFWDGSFDENKVLKGPHVVEGDTLKVTKRQVMAKEAPNVSTPERQPARNTRPQPAPKQLHHTIDPLNPHNVMRNIPQFVTRTFTEQLHAIVEAIQISTVDAEVKYGWVCTDLEHDIQSQFPGAMVMPFGSTMTRLCFKQSDVDIYVQLRPEQIDKIKQKYCDAYTTVAAWCVKRARKCLMSARPVKFSEVFAIPAAKVPIVKCHHIPTGLNVDFNFKNILGICNSRLLNFLMSLAPHWRNVMIFLKYWAHGHEITGQNRLSNYALVLLFVFYLQNEHGLPSVYQLQQDQQFSFDVEGWNGGFSSVFPFDSGRLNVHAPPKDILLGFFRFYARFQFANRVISPFVGETLDVRLFRNPSQLDERFWRYKRNVGVKVVLQPTEVSGLNLENNGVDMDVGKLVESSAPKVDDGNVPLQKKKTKKNRGKVRTTEISTTNGASENETQNIESGPKNTDNGPEITEKDTKIADSGPEIAEKDTKITEKDTKNTDNGPEITDSEPKITEIDIPEITNEKPTDDVKSLETVLSDLSTKTTEKEVNSDFRIPPVFAERFNQSCDPCKVSTNEQPSTVASAVLKNNSKPSNSAIQQPENQAINSKQNAKKNAKTQRTLNTQQKRPSKPRVHLRLESPIVVQDVFELNHCVSYIPQYIADNFQKYCLLGERILTEMPDDKIVDALLTHIPGNLTERYSTKDKQIQFTVEYDLAKRFHENDTFDLNSLPEIASKFFHDVNKVILDVFVDVLLIDWEKSERMRISPNGTAVNSYTANVITPVLVPRKRRRALTRVKAARKAGETFPTDVWKVEQLISLEVRNMGNEVLPTPFMFFMQNTIKGQTLSLTCHLRALHLEAIAKIYLFMETMLAKFITARLDIPEKFLVVR